MSDDLLAKLERMAARGTEHEREVAKTKIEALAGRLPPPPPRPPTAVAAAGGIDPEDQWWEDIMGWSGAGFPTGTGFTANGTSSTVNTQFGANVTFTFRSGENQSW